MKNRSDLILNRKGSAFIALLIVAVIIGLVFWMFARTKQRSEKHGTMMKDAGIDTSSHKTMLDSARKITQDASKPKQ